MKLLKPLDYLLIGFITILVVTIGIIAIINHDRVTCKWIAPLKVNYQECSNGTTRQVK